MKWKIIFFFLENIFWKKLNEDYDVDFLNIDEKNRKKGLNFKKIINKTIFKTFCKNCVHYKNFIILKDLNNYYNCCDYVKKVFGKALMDLKEKSSDFWFLEEKHFIDGQMNMSCFNHELMAEYFSNSIKFHNYWCSAKKQKLRDLDYQVEKQVIEFDHRIKNKKIKNI